jgi:hypothetical protein
MCASIPSLLAFVKMQEFSCAQELGELAILLGSSGE